MAGPRPRASAGITKKRRPPAAPTVQAPQAVEDALNTPNEAGEMSLSPEMEAGEEMDAEAPPEDAASFLAEALGTFRGSAPPPTAVARGATASSATATPDPAGVRRTAPGELPRRLLLGVSLEGIEKLASSRADEDVAFAKTKAKRPEFDGYVNAMLCKKDAEEDTLSTCERLEKEGSPHVGLATVFVSWHFGTAISALIDALRRHLARSGGQLDPATTFFWISDFSMNQSRVSSDLARVPEVIAHVKHTVMLLEPWDAVKTCVPLQRIHCLWELYHTALCGAKFATATSSDAVTAFATALVKQLGHVQAAIGGIDVREAKASAPRDKEMILSAVSRSIGCHAFNALIAKLMGAAVADEAHAIVRALSVGERQSRPLLLVSVAALLHDAGDAGSAEPLYREAYASLRACVETKEFDAFAGGRPEAVEGMLRAMSGLASVLADGGHLDGAEALMREELDFSRVERGDRHPDTLTSINDLAVLLGDKGDLASAEPLYRECVTAQREDLGETHPSTILGMNNLAALLRARGELADAVALHEAALAAQRGSLGSKHESTLASLYNLGTLYVEIGNLARGEELLAEEYAACRELKGPSHPDTLASRDNMDALLRGAKLFATGAPKVPGADRTNTLDESSAGPAGAAPQVA